MKINLTKEQRKHLKTIDWLLDFHKNIGMGRSYLMAVGFIKMALRHQGMWIDIFDHFPTLQAKERLLVTIKGLISADKKLLERTEFKQGSFKIN